MIALAAFAILQLAPPSADVAYREPQLATSPHLVALAFGAGNRIYVATSADEGRSFSKLVQVAQAGVLPLTRRRGRRTCRFTNRRMGPSVSAVIPPPRSRRTVHCKSCCATGSTARGICT